MTKSKPSRKRRTYGRGIKFPVISINVKVKTLSDMTEEEILAIEKTYNAKVIRK